MNLRDLSACDFGDNTVTNDCIMHSTVQMLILICYCIDVYYLALEKVDLPLC